MLRYIATAILAATMVITGASVALANTPTPSTTEATAEPAPKSITFSITPRYNSKGQETRWVLTAYNLTDRTEWTTRIPRTVAESNPAHIRAWVTDNAPMTFLSPTTTAPAASDTTSADKSEAKKNKKNKENKKGKKGKGGKKVQRPVR